MHQSGIQSAIKEAGSQQALAFALGVSAPIISMWLKRGWMPLKRCQQVEELYGVPRIETCSPAVAAFMRSNAIVEIQK